MPVSSATSSPQTPIAGWRRTRSRAASGAGRESLDVTGVTRVPAQSPGSCSSVGSRPALRASAPTASATPERRHAVQGHTKAPAAVLLHLGTVEAEVEHTVEERVRLRVRPRVPEHDADLLARDRWTTQSAWPGNLGGPPARVIAGYATATTATIATATTPRRERQADRARATAARASTRPCQASSSRSGKKHADHEQRASDDAVHEPVGARDLEARVRPVGPRAAENGCREQRRREHGLASRTREERQHRADDRERRDEQPQLVVEERRDDEPERGPEPIEVMEHAEVAALGRVARDVVCHEPDAPRKRSPNATSPAAASRGHAYRRSRNDATSPARRMQAAKRMPSRFVSIAPPSRSVAAQSFQDSPSTTQSSTSSADTASR